MSDRISRYVRMALVALLLTLAVGSYAPVSNPLNRTAVVEAASCTQMGEYTSWYYISGQWKRVLWVWIGNGGAPPDNRMEIRYNGRIVTNTDDGVRQVHQVISNGWAGYFISTRFSLLNPNWDDDWRWDARRC